MSRCQTVMFSPIAIVLTQRFHNKSTFLERFDRYCVIVTEGIASASCRGDDFRFPSGCRQLSRLALFETDSLVVGLNHLDIAVAASACVVPGACIALPA